MNIQPSHYAGDLYYTYIHVCTRVGVVVNKDRGGLESVAVNDPYFWRFTISGCHS